MQVIIFCDDQGMPDGIVFNHFFGNGSTIIAIICEIAHVSCNILQGHQKSQRMKHPFSLKPERNRINIRNMGGPPTSVKTLI